VRVEHLSLPLPRGFQVEGEGSRSGGVIALPLCADQHVGRPRHGDEETSLRQVGGNVADGQEVHDQPEQLPVADPPPACPDVGEWLLADLADVGRGCRCDRSRVAWGHKWQGFDHSHDLMKQVAGHIATLDVQHFHFLLRTCWSNIDRAVNVRLPINGRVNNSKGVICCQS